MKICICKLPISQDTYPVFLKSTGHSQEARMKTTQMKKDRTKPRNASILVDSCVSCCLLLCWLLCSPLPQSKNLDYLTLEAIKGALPSHLSFSLSLFHFRPHSLGTIKIKTGYETSCESQPDFTDIFNTWGSFIATFFFFEMVPLKP